MTDEDGKSIVHDLTQGLRMAQSSGLTVDQAVKSIFAHCGNGNVGMTTGGDKAMLKDRSGPEAVYWCRACVAVEYYKREGKPLTKNQFRKL